VRYLPSREGMKRTHITRLPGAALIILLLTIGARAADLKPETVRAWQEYVEEKNAAAKSADGPFLPATNDPDSWAALLSGKILVAPAGPNIPKRVPSGLIHDWIGTAFIPNSTIPQVLGSVRDYDHYKDVYHPSVVDSKLGSTTDEEDLFSLLLINKSLFLKKAVEGDYRASYLRLDDRRWYSVSASTRLQEIEGYGGDGARRLPEGEGAGLIWRVDSITRYEERDGGVLIQVEGMALSRDVPATMRWIVDPIIRRVSRETLQLSLQQTRDSVQSKFGAEGTAGSGSGSARHEQPGQRHYFVPLTEARHNRRLV
jgi:hypothetical protein